MCTIKFVFSYLILTVFIYSINTAFIENTEHKIIHLKGENGLDTIVWVVNETTHNATRDAIVLKETMAGLGTNEEAIIDVVTRRTNSERQEIREAYQSIYGKDLIDDLKDELSGDFKKIIVGLMRKPYEFLSKDLHRSLTSKLSSDDSAVAEILCTREGKELFDLAHAYYTMYNQTIDDDIEKHTKKDFRTFLHKIMEDVKNLRDSTNITKPVTDEELESVPKKARDCRPVHNQKFVNLLAKESFVQLHEFISLYKKKYIKTVSTSLKNYCDKDETLMNAFLTVVRYADDPIKYYAQELNEALIGPGTNDKKLIRIIVSRQEVDLGKIKLVFEELTGVDLKTSISKDTSRLFRETLLKLIARSHA